MKKYSYVLILLLAVFFSCKKSTVEVDPVEEEPANDSTFNYTSDYAYNLNVIYFIAADKTPNDDYHGRISKIMLDGQDFFNQWMVHWGFGDKSFGLLKDQVKGRIKITEIKGKFDQTHYPYSGGSAAITAEVEEYFAAHPGEKTSDHSLIIMCVKDIQQDNAPFYGIGKTCFALDYPGMKAEDLGAGGSAGNEATTWIGGMMHELGHGINLPHNGGLKSENILFGTSLMGTGNSSYGRSPTYLTKADCAILNDCQVFSKVTRSDWYTNPNTRITSLNAKYEGGNIIVSGKFSGLGSVNYVNFYNDGGKNGIGGNKDYDAVPWSAPTIGIDSFYVSMPFSEFTNTENFPYELRIMFCNKNGTWVNVPYAYELKNGQPVIDFGDKNEYDKSTWEITEFSSQEVTNEPGQAANIIDDDMTTSWVTRWSTSAPTFPHHVVVDMGQQLEVGGFTLTQRGGSSKAKDIQLLTSDDALTWNTLGSYSLTDAAGPQRIYLSSQQTFRFFKILVTSATDGRQYASLTEVGVFKN